MRVFTENKHYVDLEVEEVILGRSMSNQDISFIKSLVNSIDSSIKIKNSKDYL